MIVYFNGQYLPHNEVYISPDDRGFLFADGIYEVIRAYDGRLFRTDDHMARLTRSLHALRIDGPTPTEVRAIAERLLAENDLAEATFYMQITRGAAPRHHHFPAEAPAPTVYAFAKPAANYDQKRENGVGVILVPDQRWARCDIKSTALLPNVLASQQAKEQGVEEAVFVRDGFVTEGSHTNVCAVFDGELYTYPLTNYILPGITRIVVLELCDQMGIPVHEVPIPVQELGQAEELLILGTSTEVMPVVDIDGRPVGAGVPGPITRRLQEAFYALTRPQDALVNDKA